MTAPSALRRAVFLDRDGTLMQEREYLSDPGGVELIDGVTEALARLRAAGFALVVVTNQSGIARGLYTLADYRAVARRMDEALEASDVRPDATYFCPHHPDFTGPCDCRKPGSGMYLRAARELGLELKGSFYIGDRIKDVLPARTFGGTGILVRTGYGEEEEARLPEGALVADSLLEAATLIVRHSGGGDPA
jgi:D-glycero-D-manno-heptose 1,7-bisphosphate phosphatase